jgi:hypothetical protein
MCCIGVDLTWSARNNSGRFVLQIPIPPGQRSRPGLTNGTSALTWTAT